MKKSLFLILAVAIAIASAASSYTIKKLPAGQAPIIDGNYGEWTEDYFIDSLRSDANVFCELKDSAWKPEEFSYKVYAAHDDINFYFCFVVTADNVFQDCGEDGIAHYECDNIKINLQGKGTSIYIWGNGTSYYGPSCTWIKNVSAWTAGNHIGYQGKLPVYEAALSIEKTAPYGNIGKFSVGSEEVDGYTTIPDVKHPGQFYLDQTFLCIGVSGPTNKWNFDNNPWDNMSYWPSWATGTVEGGALASELGSKSVSLEGIKSQPNPMTSSTTLSYKSLQNGKLDIYNISGKVVKSVSTLAGNRTVTWNGTDMNGKAVAAGVYVARLTSGSKSFDTRLFLAR